MSLPQTKKRVRLPVEPRVRRCGACGKKFKFAKELVEHLKICDVANMCIKIIEKTKNDIDNENT